jgi:ATP-binding cassette subfamily C (CFTR/MRP) protein 1
VKTSLIGVGDVRADYLATSRELKRLDAVTKSPIFASFSETLNGLSTIRAFRQQRRFEALNDARIERNLEAGFLSVTANRWLAIRLEFIGAIVILASALFAVSGLGTARKLDAGCVLLFPPSCAPRVAQACFLM